MLFHWSLRSEFRFTPVARDLRRFEVEGARATPGRLAQSRDQTIWLGDPCESREKWDEASPAGGAYPPGIALHPAGEDHLVSRTRLVPWYHEAPIGEVAFLAMTR